jgi:hypothetical protein
MASGINNNIKCLYILDILGSYGGYLHFGGKYHLHLQGLLACDAV